MSSTSGKTAILRTEATTPSLHDVDCVMDKLGIAGDE